MTKFIALATLQSTKAISTEPKNEERIILFFSFNLYRLAPVANPTAPTTNGK